MTARARTCFGGNHDWRYAYAISDTKFYRCRNCKAMQSR